MTKQFHFQKTVNFLGVFLLSIIGFSFLVKHNFSSNSNPKLILALTLDFLVSIPLIYFLIIRKSSVPKYTLISVFIFCLFLAGYILPAENREVYDIVKMVALPLIEISIFTFLFIQFIKTKQTFKQAKDQGAFDFFTSIKSACKNHFPKAVSGVLATEIAVIYYCLFPIQRTQKANTFTYHKKSGILSVIYAFMGLALVEGIAVHMVIARYHVMTAWILTLLTAYSILQIYALSRSMKYRLIQIDKDSRSLYLNYGFFAEAKIPFHGIQEVELTKKSLKPNSETKQFSPLGMLDTHNVVLHFNSPITYESFYGRKVTCASLAIYLDDKETFKSLLEVQINSVRCSWKSDFTL